MLISKLWTKPLTSNATYPQHLPSIYPSTLSTFKVPQHLIRQLTYLSVSVGLLRITGLDKSVISWPRAESSTLDAVEGSSQVASPPEATLVDILCTPFPLRVNLIWSSFTSMSQNVWLEWQLPGLDPDSCWRFLGDFLPEGFKLVSLSLLYNQRVSSTKGNEIKQLREEKSENQLQVAFGPTSNIGCTEKMNCQYITWWKTLVQALKLKIAYKHLWTYNSVI